MSQKFYDSVVQEECKEEGIKQKMLKPAFKIIANAYCGKALKAGNTFVNYDNPINRCAYLHKFAKFHTDLVYKYFSSFLSKEESKKILMSKRTLTICCLGGGPGTDIVGIFKALAKIPHFRKKVVKVVILDICRGWCNSFKFIVSSLLDGKLKAVPADFIDTSKFVAEITEVNLLEPLPGNVVEAIAAADVICSIKFISAIYSDPASLSAMKTIADNIKPQAVVLFIDNPAANLCKFVETVSKTSGFKILLGPLHGQHHRLIRKTSNKAMFKGVYHTTTPVSVIGMVKSKKTGAICNGTVPNHTPRLISIGGSSVGKVKSKSDEVVNTQTSGVFDNKKSNVKALSKGNKFTQTDLHKLNKCTQTDLHKLNKFTQTDYTRVASNFDDGCSIRLVTVLESLATSLNSLLVNVDKYMQKTCEKKCCSCCHC